VGQKASWAGLICQTQVKILTRKVIDMSYFCFHLCTDCDCQQLEP